MATPNAQSGEIRENASPPPYGAEPESDRAVRYDIPRTSINPASDNWMGAASFVFAGISGIGLLVVVAGVYLAASDLAILIGVGIMCLAALGWAVVAVVMIGIIIKRWFAFSSTAGKAFATSQARMTIIPTATNVQSIMSSAKGRELVNADGGKLPVRCHSTIK